MGLCRVGPCFQTPPSLGLFSVLSPLHITQRHFLLTRTVYTLLSMQHSRMGLKRQNEWGWPGAVTALTAWVIMRGGKGALMFRQVLKQALVHCMI